MFIASRKAVMVVFCDIVTYPVGTLLLLQTVQTAALWEEGVGVKGNPGTLRGHY